MAVTKGPLLGGLLLTTGLTIGVSGYILVAAVLLRAAGEVLPPNSVAALGGGLVLLGGVLLWVGSAVLPGGL